MVCLKNKTIIAALFIGLTCVNCSIKTYMLETAGNAKGKRFYIKDIHNHYEDIVGVWRWENGNDSFEITFKKFEKYSYPKESKQFYDKIFGKYKFVKGGEIVSEVSQINPFPKAVVNLGYMTPEIYNIIIHDVTSDINKKGKLVFVETNKALLRLKDIENIRLERNEIELKNLKKFSLPVEILLNRVSD